MTPYEEMCRALLVERFGTPARAVSERHASADQGAAEVPSGQRSGQAALSSLAEASPAGSPRSRRRKAG